MVDDQVIKIGLFTEGKFLSNGTFADAYEINDDNGNPAILKWLRADAPKGGVERFQNESWALRQLSHPSIPHYISEGEHEGRPYIVMARAPGFSLRKRLNVAVGERGTFGETWVLRIIVSVLSAVCAAQKSCIIHRDIKDDNVVCDDNAEKVTLIDFGFCKGETQPVDADSFYQVGAPRYSPPAKLRHPSVTHPSHDVFAVGVLAYLLLTNAYPWSVSADQNHGFLAEMMDSTIPPEITDLNSIVSFEMAEFVRALIVTNDSARLMPDRAYRQAMDLVAKTESGVLRYLSNYSGKFPKITRDPVHGDIRLSKPELDVIDSRSFQRMRLIKQLGFANLVYFGAEHTRLAHSIGTMHVADQMARAISDGTNSTIDPEERLLIRMYALVHDIGHLPFGHTIEDELGFFPRHDKNRARMKRLLGGDEYLQAKLGSTSYGKLILDDMESSKSNLSLTLARDIVDGHTGADVLDYVDRDSIFCGVDHKVDSAIYRQFVVLPLSSPNGEPVRRLVTRHYGSLGIRSDASFAIESLLTQRFALFMKVYTHPIKLAAGAMVGKALQEIIANIGGEAAEQAIERMGDEEFLLWMAAPDKPEMSRALVGDLSGRMLYKAVYMAEPVPSDDRSFNGYSVAQENQTELGMESPSRRALVEAELAHNAGVKNSEVIVYWPREAPGLQKIRHYIQDAPGKSPSTAVSALNSKMIERHISLWRIYVFVHPEMAEDKREDVRIAAQAYFGRENMVRATKH